MVVQIIDRKKTEIEEGLLKIGGAKPKIKCLSYKKTKLINSTKGAISGGNTKFVANQ